jgi:AcrR family transcriptional regulator
MTTATPTPRYQEKQDHILSVAGRVFAQKGYHEASMRDIARESGASLAGLYYYAQSKEELLYAISARALDTVVEGARRSIASATDPEEQLRRVIDNHLRYFVAHLDEMKVLSHEAESLTGEFADAIHERKRTYVALVEHILRNMNGALGKERRIEALSLFGMMNWVYTWYRPDDGGIDAISRTMSRVFLDGFRTASRVDH